MSFWRFQKDKSGLGSGRNVFLESSKGQKRLGWCSECPFGGFKKTKVAWLVFEMSFWRLQKDKSGLGSVRNVFLESSKRQKEPGQRLKCPFEGFKKTKVAWLVFGMSFWRVQRDKKNPCSDRNVLLEVSKRQKEPGQRSKCPFGGLKRPKAAWLVFGMSFWRVQKDKRNPGSVRNVLLESSKGQKEPGQ